MITNKHIALAALAALALAAAALSSTKNPVERSVDGYFIAKWVVSMADGTSTTEQTGILSHVGLCTLTASGVWDLNTFTIVSASGVATAANGDQILWELTPGGPFLITCTGGTGRFAGITGGLNTTWQSDPVVTVDPDAGTMTIELSYTVAGTLTY